jgi:hypothetical protein
MTSITGFADISGPQIWAWVIAANVVPDGARQGLGQIGPGFTAVGGRGQAAGRGTAGKISLGIVKKYCGFCNLKLVKAD